MGESEQKERPDRQPLGAYIDVDQHRQLAELARAEDRSVSAIVRRAIAHELEREAEEATA